MGRKTHHNKVKRDNISAGSFIESRHSSQSQNSIRLHRIKKDQKLNLMEQKNLFVSKRSSQQAFTEQNLGLNLRSADPQREL